MEVVILDNFGDIRAALREVDCTRLRYAIYNIEENVLECAGDNAPPQAIEEKYRLDEDCVEMLQYEVEEETPSVILGYDFERGKAYAIAATHDLCEASAAMCEVAAVLCNAASGLDIRDQFDHTCRCGHVECTAEGPSVYSLDDDEDEPICDECERVEPWAPVEEDENIGLQLRRLSIFRHSKK